MYSIDRYAILDDQNIVENIIIADAQFVSGMSAIRLNDDEEVGIGFTLCPDGSWIDPEPEPDLSQQRSINPSDITDEMLAEILKDIE